MCLWRNRGFWRRISRRGEFFGVVAQRKRARESSIAGAAQSAWRCDESVSVHKMTRFMAWLLMAAFATILWGLWRLRCLLLFGNQSIAPLFFINCCLQFSWDWNITQASHRLPVELTTSTIQWFLPNSGSYKANVDAGYSNFGTAYIGGLIRDDKGTWCIGFQQSISSHTTLEVRLLTEDYRLQHPLRPLLTDCHQRLMQCQSVKILHVSRKQNGAAHLLTKLAKSLTDSFLHVLYSPPDALCNILNCEANCCTL